MCIKLRRHLGVSFLLARPPNGPVLFCSLVSVVVVVCNAAGGRAGRVGCRAADTTAGQYGYVQLGRQLVMNSVEIHCGRDPNFYIEK